jgi:CO/xanthine dehydrogenase FAD-binding subunit
LQAGRERSGEDRGKIEGIPLQHLKKKEPSMIHDFKYLKPAGLQEALSLLADHQDECKIICGGQSLLIVMRQGLVVTDYLIDIKGLQELSYITYEEKKGLTLGATTTHRTIEKSELLKRKYPALVFMERKLASIQVRNWGTIGGNLAHGDSSGDLAPTLIAMDASIKLSSSKKTRVMPLEEFYTALFETALNKDEMVVEVQVPPPRPRTATVYQKFNLLESDQAIVGVAATVETDKSGTCQDARIVLSNAGVTPVRARKAEKVLLGEKMNGVLLGKAGEVAAEEADPVSDIHASEAFRRHLVKILTKRMAGQAWEQAVTLG